jgi:PAS domain S-box-containing protein
VLVTRAGAPVAVDGLMAGANDYIAKPFAARELVARIGTQIALARVRRRGEELNAFLVRFSDAVRGLVDPREVARVACRMVVEQLGAERARWSEADWAAREWVIEMSHAVNGVSEGLGRYTFDASEPLTSIILAGHTLTVEDSRTDPRLPPELKQRLVSLDIIANVNVVVMANGRVRATLSIQQRAPRRWTQEEVGLLEGVAGRCWAEVERARAEERLRDSEARYRALFDTMVEGYLLCEAERDEGGQVVDFRFIAVNNVAARMLGYERADVEGKRRSELTPPDPETTQIVIEVMDTGRPLRRERHSTVLDGWLQFDVFPQGGDRVAILASDITEAKRDEHRQAFLLKLSDTLRPLADATAIQAASTALLRAYFDVARSYYMEVDDDAGVAYCRAESGCADAPSALGRYELVHFKETANGLRQGKPLVRDDWDDVEVGDGSAHVLSTEKIRSQITIPLIKQGKLVATLAVNDTRPRRWRDDDLALVSEVATRTWAAVERARAEEALRRSLGEATAARAEAEAANRANDEFLAIVSHELRTPLAAITIWAQAMRSGSVPPSELGRAIEAIAQSAASQSRLVEDILDLSRLAARKLLLDRSAVLVVEVARAAIEMIRPSADAKRLSLETDLEEHLGPALLDPARLEQILWNLLSNATKFTPEGGKIRLAVHKRESNLEIDVEDDGAGIARDFIPHVFDKFRQFDMGDTRQHAGLGIGLALTRQLVELHGGTIEARSEGLGKGSVFLVRLPWVDAEFEAGVAASAASALPPNALEGVRVLLVEDDADTRDAMSWMLTRAGAAVTPVGSAPEALAVLGISLDGAPPSADGAAETSDASPDVMVSDLGLPGMSGYELIEQIDDARRRLGRRLPPACAVSAHARDVDRRRAIEKGYELYLVKPIAPEELIQAVIDLRDVAAHLSKASD